MERVVAGCGAASEQELRDYRPGGAENRDRGTWGWVNWKMHLGRFNARADGAGDARRGGGDPEAAVLRSLRREPALIEPVFPAAPGMPSPLAIHPKGLDALLWFHARGVLLGELAHAHAQLDAHRTPEALAGQIEAVLLEISYQERLLVWGTTHPGPWLPFDPHTTPAPPVPAWTLALDAFDILRVVRRHHDVNGGRLVALQELVRPPRHRDDGSPFAWSVFASTVADQLHEPVSLVMRDRTLEELFAQAALANDAKRRAYEHAREQVEH